MNLPTAIGTVIVMLAVGAVIAGMIKNKKKGKSLCSCAGGCKSCPMGCKCNKS